MTAFSAPPSSGPLARHHRALPRLAVLLRGADLSVGPDRWQNLYDLLLALSAQGRLPEQAAGLESLIAPLLCRSERDQQQFGELFARWLADLESDLRGAGEGTEPAEAQRTPAPEPLLAPRLRWWLLGFAAFLAFLAGAAWITLSEQPGMEPPPATEEAVPLQPSVEDIPSPPDTTPELTLQSVPPRTPPKKPTLNSQHRAKLENLENLGYLLLLLPGFIALAWLLARWLTWKTVLQRRKGDPDDPLTAIGLDARIDDLLNAPALRDALKRLHVPVAVPIRRLDVDATVARTARHAGLFQPVRRERRTVRELVVLVEQRHAGDQMAGLAGQLVDRLHEAGLTLHRYDYRDSPVQLISLDGRWRPLEEVVARHEGARLLLIGEPAALIDPFSGEPLPWTRALAPWPERGLLVTRRPPERWRVALAASGFVVAELDSAGVQSVALHFRDRHAASELSLPNLTVVLPRLLRDIRRWAQPVAPGRAEQDALLAALDAYLGAEGTRLLATMAVYPQLHWGLTRVLDLSLFPASGPIARERRLLKVARLPWSRAGWLPDWLRAALLEPLDRAAERDIRQLYRKLLQLETTVGGGRIALPIALPRAVGLWAGVLDWLRHKSWRLDRWLTGLKALSAQHGALNDAIFAGVLFGWRPRLLDFVLPRRLLRRRMGGALGQALAPRLVLAVLLALGGAWFVDHAWHQWGRERADSYLLAKQKAALADYRITIWHLKETAELAQALNDTLKADGFTAEIADTTLEPLGGDTEPLAPVNKIQWGHPTDVDMTTQIEQRLMYLTWGHDPEVTNKLGPLAAQADLAEPPSKKELRVILLTPGTTGSSFFDPLIQTLTPEQNADLVTPRKPSEPPEKPVQTPTPPQVVEAVEQLQTQIDESEQQLD